MACFSDPDQALKTAIELQKIFFQDRTDTSIRLRISLHVGQVIAVHLLHGLDLFGTTVNEAAKLQSCAETGEIAFSDTFRNALSQDFLNSCVDQLCLNSLNLMQGDRAIKAHVLNCFQNQKSSRLAS